MAYTSGILKDKITILNRTAAVASKFGTDSAGVQWQDDGTIWASVDWAKGKRALNAGAIDAYAVVLVRCRFTSVLTMRSRIVHEGVTYQILPETFHPDYQENTIQFNAQAVIDG